MILAEGLHEWGRWAVPLFSYTLVFALRLRKSTGNLSELSRLALDTSRCVELAALLGATSTVLLSINLPRLPWVTSVSPWLAQVPSKLPNYGVSN
jgi:hypothetical protein